MLKLKKPLMVSASSSGQIFGIVIGRKALFAGLMMMSATMGFGVWGLYGIYQADQMSVALQQTQRALDHAQMRKDAKLAELQMQMLADEKKLAVYARALGQMQARISRLDMLGAKLVNVASLDKSEFDFGLEPAFGGPRQKQLTHNTGTDIEDRMTSLDERLKQLGTQLTAVDFILESKRDAQAARPHAWPTEGGWISSRFGPRLDPFNGTPSQHYGVDIANRHGAPIMASSRGVVTFAGKMEDFGYVVDVEHGHGYKTRYAHMGSMVVNIGDVVESNQLIGRIGSTGHSTGPHLHYEVRRYGELINPRSFMPRG
ncbi:murein DD-endopeptidase MepM [Mariprofundus micogutta]|uniref:Murein DD-endopeptidase MepM n=1 Tax=Mariprofundus micogutta TaxID=1921010 RepID=A0A1L8CM59_9PROT|nr:M23 family metallopeptidase [Mariprofundus micogutta]GAV19993.1 murein DD-endopeptidase MepM [Mariprofundus micogutta]